MKTNSKVFVWAFSLLGLALMAASCEKFGGGGSRYVRFRAVVQSAAGGVRTEYSGDVDQSGFERINWKEDDKIRLYSDFATNPDDGDRNYADYTISAATPSERKSIATVSADIGNGLMYAEGQTYHRFWGIYPYHAMTVSETGSSATATASGLELLSPQYVSERQDMKVVNTDEVTGNVTNVTYKPDMSHAWMLAEQSGVRENVDFDLLFHPAFTAFEFTLKSQFEELTVKSFTLSSANTALVGQFSASYSESDSKYIFDCPDPSDSNKTIVVNFDTGVSVTQTQSLTFTVLALPRDIRKLTVDFLINVNGADIHRTLALTNENNSFTSKDSEGFIIFPACQKYRIIGLALPSGDLEMSIDVNDWVVGANDYNYFSDVTCSLQCWSGGQAGGEEIHGGETYRRYDEDDVYTDWSGSHIVVSYGYRNPSGDVIITEDPEGYQVTQNTLLRPAFSPILELVTTSGPSNVLQLHLDNPNFKFIQYGNIGGLSNGGLDLSVRDHSKTDYLDIDTGSDVRTFFSVVPVKQFTVDAQPEEKVCRIFLLSVSPGILHELSFNLTNGSTTNQALPGENTSELKFMYVGPSIYDTTGREYDATGTEVTP